MKIVETGDLYLILEENTALVVMQAGENPSSFLIGNMDGEFSASATEVGKEMLTRTLTLMGHGEAKFARHQGGENPQYVLDSDADGIPEKKFENGVGYELEEIKWRPTKAYRNKE